MGVPPMRHVAKPHPDSLRGLAPRLRIGEPPMPRLKMVKPLHKPLQLTVDAQVGKSFIPHLRRHLRAAHRMLRTRLRELSLILVNDETMSRLHHQAMGLPGPTDVLTFPLDLNNRGRPVSGEVYVCVPEARRQAKELGTRVVDELLLYALHGMLHLSGFDDRTPTEFDRMHRTEDAILTRLGIGAVFRPQRRSLRRARASR